MKNYRLRKECRKYFNNGLHDKIENIHYWYDKHISKDALQEVGDVYLTYGHMDKNTTHLCGHSNLNNDDKGSHFFFTINFPFHNNKDYHTFKNTSLELLMDNIQQTIDVFCREHKP